MNKYYTLWLALPSVLLLCSCAPAGKSPTTPPTSPPKPALATTTSAPTETPAAPIETPASVGDLQPWEPRPSDSELSQANAMISREDVVTLESHPPQYQLILEGSLPTPCHQLRVMVNPPADDRQIKVEVYSLVKPDIMCAQVLEPFKVTVPVEKLPSGTYSVIVNGQKIGEITAP